MTFNVEKAYEDIISSGTSIIVLENGEFAAYETESFKTWSLSNTVTPTISTTLTTSYKIMIELKG